MYKTYLYVAKAAVGQGLRLAMAKWGLSFLGGPLGTIFSFFVSPILALLLMDGVVYVEFKQLEIRNKKDMEKYLKAKEMGRNAKNLTPEQREEMLKEIIEATRNFVSAKKYLK